MYIKTEVDEAIEFLEALKKDKEYPNYHIEVPYRVGAKKYTPIHYGIDKIIKLLKEQEACIDGYEHRITLKEV